MQIISSVEKRWLKDEVKFGAGRIIKALIVPNLKNPKPNFPLQLSTCFSHRQRHTGFTGLNLALVNCTQQTHDLRHQ